MDVMDLIPAPFGPMHAQWLKRRQLSSTLSNSCRAGRAVFLQHRSGRQVPVVLTVKDGEAAAAVVKEKEGDAGKFYTVRAMATTSDNVALSYRMQFVVGPDLVVGKVLCSEESFGYKPADLEGQRLTGFLEGLPTEAEGIAVLSEMVSQGRAEGSQITYRVGFRASSGAKARALDRLHDSATGPNRLAMLCRPGGPRGGPSDGSGERLCPFGLQGGQNRDRDRHQSGHHHHPGDRDILPGLR